MSLRDARRWVQASLTTGIACPCCDQYAREYRRSINSAMARTMILLYRFVPADGWVKVEDLFNELRVKGIRWVPVRADEAKLRYWELIEAKQGVRDDDSDRLGIYRLTALGRRFVRREIQVTRTMLVYNSAAKPVTDAPLIWIDEALGKRFNYRALMEGTP